MKSFEIEDIRNFMNELLIQDKYDSFYLYEARVKTSLDYYVSGRVNEDFFDSKEEVDEFCGEKNIEYAMDGNSNGSVTYAPWGRIKHMVFDLIKGKRLPISFKIVLMFNRYNIEKLVEMNNLPIRPQDINALSMNICYDNSSLFITTGASLKIFTMDKTLEHIWDETIEKYYI